MQSDRREFLKCLSCAAGAGALAPAVADASSGAHGHGPEDPMGVLIDLTECIGCRRCEFACRKANGIEPGAIESYDDQSVFAKERRPGPDSFTVVNAYKPRRKDDTTVYVKFNCMHCNYPACVSACIVGALDKQENGAVTYDAWKCIGCRYCMVACPFQLPAYDYDDVLTPRVRKCELCFADRTGTGGKPACVEECPRNAMKYARRKDLLTWAHAQIEKHPDKYQKHIYGEHEVGGTSWMYLSPAPFEKIGMLTLGSTAPPALTEAIQHGVFKYWIAPVGWYAFLSTMYWWTGRRAHAHQGGHGEHPGHGQDNRLLGHEAPSGAVVSSPLAEIDGFEHDSGMSGWRHSSAGSMREASGGGIALAEPDGIPSSPVLPDHTGADDHDESAPDAHDAAHAHHEHGHAAPVNHKLLTPGVWVLIAMVLVGAAFGLYRFIFGLGATTNLDQQRPWGLWIAMDVGSGIALAGGGFIGAAIFHVFHRQKYHGLARSALLTALLGYTFYVPGLLADIGRWYNIWHPTIPTMWQGNSVLFEVGLCVMIYLNVQYAELLPIICERLLGESWIRRWPRLHWLVEVTHSGMNRLLPALLVLGVCLSTFHQSSLGNLMVIAPYKLHELWWSPLAPLHFLLSAAMVGLPMIIFTILFASWCLHREPEMDALSSLARRYVPVFIVLYLVSKVGDMIWRGTYPHLISGSYESTLWLLEMEIGVIVPLVLLCFSGIRNSPRWLAITCMLVILGVVINRLNVFVLAFHPPYQEKPYFPSVTEFMLSMGLVAALLLCYRIGVTYLPILEARPKVRVNGHA